MATIPIEVIIQDAESPVTPTPESGEETNITVPDTGAEVAGSNSTFASSSAASIILPTILLVVTLATICAVLIHKHRKYQNDKLSKKEKFTTVTSGAIAILAATVLVGNLVIPVTSAATDDTNTNREGELVVDDKITITVTREAGSDETIASSIDTKSYATVYKTFGYEVAIAMAGNTTNLYLNGDTSSEYYIAPVSDGALTDNTWGYTLDGEEYTAMPLIDNLAVIAKGTTPVSNEEVDINYGVKVASDMPAGTYTGEIEYILADTGFPAALRTMQDMTTAICSSVPTPNPFKSDNTTIEDNVPTIMLPDSRDNKLYRVAKLADGKCWMTQNLDLQKEDLLAGVVLNDSNTDHPATGFALPTSQTEGDESWGNAYAPSKTDAETTHVYDIAYSGTEYKYCIDLSHGECFEYSDNIPTVKLGNLYNFYTATAGTGTYELGSSDNKEASGSICPANWRLPNNSNNDEATDYSNLLYLYGITQSPTSSSYVSADKAAVYKAPLSLVPTSNYYNGLGEVGMSGALWSSMAYGNGNARYLSFNSVSVNLWSGNLMINGDAVRCLAR